MRAWRLLYPASCRKGLIACQKPSGSWICGECPQCGSSTSAAPGMPAASSWERAGGVAVSRRPTTTSVGIADRAELGAAIELRRARGRRRRSIPAWRRAGSPCAPRRSPDVRQGNRRETCVAAPSPEPLPCRRFRPVRPWRGRRACLAAGWQRRCRPAPAGRTAGRAGRPVPPRRSRRSRCPAGRHRRTGRASAVALRCGRPSVKPGPGGRRCAEAGQIDQPDAPLGRQTRRDAIEGGAIGKQRMQQHQVAAVAHLHDVERGFVGCHSRGLITKSR